MADERDKKALYDELVSTRVQLTEVVEQLIEANTIIRLMSRKVTTFEYGEMVSTARHTREKWKRESTLQNSGYEQILSREMARRGHGG